MTPEENWSKKYRTMPVPLRNPCDRCKFADTCDSICPARAKWWDHCVKREKVKRNRKLYTVYDLRHGGRCVCENARAEEAAIAMGLAHANSLYGTLTAIKQGTCKHWRIDVKG